MSGYSALIPVRPFALLPPRHAPAPQPQPSSPNPYATTLKTALAAEDRVLRCMVFAPLAFPLHAPALLLAAGLEIFAAALVDTALLPAELQKKQQRACRLP
ncbi:MAG: hypothetical protein V7756_02025 [Halopseudomonas sp.]|uniref:hypothetical protein n=1 Tax=Halopseudomonas sp. TaxID=2901191 RepID=UPI00300389EB